MPVLTHEFFGFFNPPGGRVSFGTSRRIAGSFPKELMRHYLSRNLTFALLLLACPCTFAANPPTTNPVKPDPHKFEKEIAAFEAADQKAFPPPGAILFIGDSSIRLWKSLAEDFPGEKVINRGFGGSSMADALRYADRIVTPYKPRLIVLREGGNDLTLGVPAEQIVAELESFVKTVRAALPGVRIAVCSLSPNPARWDQAQKRKQANALLKASVAKGTNLEFIEVWEEFLGPDGKPREDLFIQDRLHYNEAGYRVYANALRPHLQP